MKKLFILMLCSLAFTAFGQNALNRVASDQGGIKLNYTTPDYSFTTVSVGESEMLSLELPGVLLPGESGSPNLPTLSKYVAIPTGANAKLTVEMSSFETLKDIAVAPAPEFKAEVEDGPSECIINTAVYSTDAFYPAEPVIISEVQTIRGVEVVMVSITPFQYNPVTKELRAFEGFDINIDFEGGKGTFGDDRLRSRFFDPMLSDLLVNYDLLPEIDYAARITNAVASKEDGCEYLIIIPNGPDFAIWADTIWQYRQQQGVITKVVTLAEIGTSTAVGIKTYVQQAYLNWDIPPAAILFMADYGSDDEKYITSTTVTHEYSGTCITDNSYVDVNNDDLPDMATARMCASTAAHLEVMVTKFIDYERNPPVDSEFYNKPITALGWQTERWFQLCSEVIGGYFRSAGKEPVRINAIYDGNPSTIWSSATNTTTVVNYFGPNGLDYIPQTPAELGGWSGGTAAQVNAAINDGAFILTHRDHGSTSGWGEPSYTSNNVIQLHNVDNRLPFVFSMNCLTGKFDKSGTCFAEVFHRRTYNGQNSGALGLIAATEVSYSFVNDVFMWGLMDNLMVDFMPDESTSPVSRGFLPCFGNVAGKYFLKQSSWPYNSGSKAITYKLFHHHGDAFTTVFTEVPEALTIVHENSMQQFATEFFVTADEGAIVCLSANSEILGVGVGTGESEAISFASYTGTDDVLITVTKQNFFRYEVLLSVDSGPVVSIISDTTLCSGLTLQLDPEASNYTDVAWETTGTGEFSDLALIDPIYTPSDEDLTSEGVELSVTVSRDGESSEATTTLGFRTTPEKPVAIQGETALCLNPENQIYTTVEDIIADSYSWELIPSNAGGMNSDSASVRINWLNDFSGKAKLVVEAINSCGVSEVSDTIEVVIYEVPSAPAIPQGDNIVCVGMEAIFSVDAGVNAETMTWSVEPETEFTVSENAITILAEVGEYSIAAKVANPCGESEWSEMASLVVSPLLAAPAVEGEVEPCMNTNELYTIQAVEGAIGYIWTIEPEDIAILTPDGLTCEVLYTNSAPVAVQLSVVAEGGLCGGIAGVFEIAPKDCSGVDILTSQAIELYPNPSEGEITVAFGRSVSGVSYRLYNSIGQVVKSGQIEGAVTTLDFTTQAKGVYFIHFSGDEVNAVEQVVIK